MTTLARPETRIVLRPIGSPLPLGFFTFAIGMFVLAAPELGLVTAVQGRTSDLVLLTFVAPLELLAAVLAFLARDTLSGTALGFFAMSWTTFGVLGLTSPAGSTSPATGYYSAIFAVVVLALASVAVRGQLLVTSTLLLSAVRAAALTVYQVGGARWAERTVGGLGVAIAALAVYGGLAFALQDATGHGVLPVGRRGMARRSVEEGGSALIDDADIEAGVRPRL